MIHGVGDYQVEIVAIYLASSLSYELYLKNVPSLFVSVRFFRVIPAEVYLTTFSSDRRHMRRPDGSWIKPPPSYAPIQTMCK